MKVWPRELEARYVAVAAGRGRERPQEREERGTDLGGGRTS